MISRAAVAAAVTALLVLGGATTAGAKPGPVARYPVTTTTLTLVDTSRPTVDPSHVRDAPSRTLVTDVYRPRARGRFPVVLLAHGFNGNRSKLSDLAETWAAGGSVVAVPEFPLTNDRSGAPAYSDDYHQQPADLSFVLTELLHRSARRGNALTGTINPRRVGVAGFSLGGVTVYGMAYNSCCRDPRVDAVLLMDTAPLGFGEGTSYRPYTGPIMLVHLRHDPLVPYALSQVVYRQAKPPKLLMTLQQGVHPEPYENIASPHDGAVEAATTRFWDVYLAGRGTIGSIVRAGTEPGLSTVRAVG